MAKAKTTRQIAASRRNIRKAQIVSARKRRGTGRRKPINRRTRAVAHVKRHKIAYGAATGVAAIGAVAAYDKYGRIPLYHNTSMSAAQGIKLAGFKGTRAGSLSNALYGAPVGQVYFTAGKNESVMFGDTVVRIKMSKRKFKKIARPDAQMRQLTNRAYMIHSRNLTRYKGRRVRVKKGDLMQQHFSYLYKSVHFPNGK